MKQLDRQAAAVLERIRLAGLPPYRELGPQAGRALYRKSRAALAPPPPEVALADDFEIPGPAGRIAIRHYRGHGTTPSESLPALVYFHGGGHTIGDLDTHDVVCREFANAGRCAVVSVDYRLAPEHRFPAAFDDAVAAVRWVATEGAKLGIDRARVAVGGDSAGGNLAAAAAIAARDAGGPPLAMQVLVYPTVDMAYETPSSYEYGEGYLLTRDTILWFRANYLRGEHDVGDWRASPARAPSLARLPPACVITAGFDPLLDEGRAYAERLHAEGVPTVYECFEGQIHGFITMGAVIAAAHHAIYRACQFMRVAWGGGKFR
ncbi:MAG: alpha/beta hydrolase [Burkholderiales bacterium]|nr:alpha/beta hydrolase [Burkholderiales bacterium]